MDRQCLKNYLQIVLNGKKIYVKSQGEVYKNYDEDSDKGNIPEVDGEYPQRYHDLPLLPEKIKIKKRNRLACNLYDKSNYVEHLRTLKQALNHGLILKKCIK